MNAIKKAAARAQEFVSDHKTAITIATTVTATTVACITLTRVLSSGFTETLNDFLSEKNLTEEFNALLEEV